MYIVFFENVCEKFSNYAQCVIAHANMYLHIYTVHLHTAGAADSGLHVILDKTPFSQPEKSSSLLTSFSSSC